MNAIVDNSVLFDIISYRSISTLDTTTRRSPAMNGGITAGCGVFAVSAGKGVNPGFKMTGRILETKIAE